MASVLIIDDHQGTRDTFATVLRHEGYDAVTACAGRAGLDAALTRRFDLHLVDLMLPDMSGVEVVRQLRRAGVRSPAVIVTAFPSLDTSFDAADAGAQGYVPGMLLPDELVAIVSQALAGRFPVRHPGPETERAPTDLRPDAVPKTDPRVAEMIRAIDAHLGELLSPEEIAAMLQISESRARHLFEEQVGVPLMRFVKERRLQEGASRLTTSMEYVSQIARRLGFSSSRRFTRLFHKRFGMAPRAYRARFWKAGRVLE